MILAADTIDLLRRPVFPPAPPLPDVAAEPFSVPELPVSVRVQELDVGSITLAEEIVGQAAELSLSGRLTLADGGLDTALELVRTDRPGGRFDLAAAFSNESRQLAIDLDVAAHLFVKQSLDQVVHLHVAQVTSIGVSGLANIGRHQPFVKCAFPLQGGEHGGGAPAVARILEVDLIARLDHLG